MLISGDDVGCYGRAFVQLVGSVWVVMNCVYGLAFGAKASAKGIECVDAVPCDGVAR